MTLSWLNRLASFSKKSRVWSSGSKLGTDAKASISFPRGLNLSARVAERMRSRPKALHRTALALSIEISCWIRSKYAEVCTAAFSIRVAVSDESPRNRRVSSLTRVQTFTIAIWTSWRIAATSKQQFATQNLPPLGGFRHGAP